MNYTSIIISIPFIVLGLSAIIFNKYPSQKVSLEALQQKNKNRAVSMKKLCKIDGAFYLLQGLIFLVLGLYYKTIQQSIPLFVGSIVLIVILLAAYYPTRNRFVFEK